MSKEVRQEKSITNEISCYELMRLLQSRLYGRLHYHAKPGANSEYNGLLLDSCRCLENLSRYLLEYNEFGIDPNYLGS